MRGRAKGFGSAAVFCAIVLAAMVSLSLGLLNLVKTAAEGAITILRDPKLTAPDKRADRVARLKEVIDPIFDYEEMARRSLGNTLAVKFGRETIDPDLHSSRINAHEL